MAANALAIFAVKPPVEPTGPNQDLIGDDSSDFKNFMDTAVHKTDTAQKPSKENSPQNQNDTQTGKTQSQKPKTEPKDEENSNYQEVSVSSQDKPQTKLERVSKESLIEDTEVLSAQLQELDINQDQFEALLDLLGLNGDADMDDLLETLSQALNMAQENAVEKTQENAVKKTGVVDLLNRIQQNKGEAVDLLKQAGLSEQDANKLLDHLQSLKNAHAQKELNKEFDLQAKIDSQLRQSSETTTKNSEIENTQDDTEEGPNVLAQLKNPAKETEKTDTLSKRTEKTNSSSSADKLHEKSKQNEAPRITNQEPVREKPGATSNLGELLIDKNTQANILQTESFSDGKNIKGLETTKASPDLQIQPPTTTANNAVKSVESSKPILPENLLARGATEAKIINQIADKMTIRSNGSKNEVHLKLDPPSLGTVRMNITTSGDTVRTVIVAENHAVKQVIENNFNQLRDAMGEQGLKVDSFTVTVGGESNQENQFEDSSSKENIASMPEDTIDKNLNEKEEIETLPLFFNDNQSISIIA
ncbi:MAG: flagellar hook-length control protein FliK [Nitrospinae bacterium]|nr:flagellar hook-length control protein FliK [Nitrospinota bacterium]